MRDFRNYPKPNLTDDDLLALGAIVSYWSFAEMSFEWIISLLISAGRPTTDPYAKERQISFKKKAVVYKKLLQITCGDKHPNHLEVGLALSSVGKSLADRRKIAVHWRSSRISPQNEPMINFIDFGWLVAQRVSQKTVEPTDISELACDIAECMLSPTVGPLASLTTFHGPEHVLASPKWGNFRTIQRIRRTPTSDKPTPPPRSSLAWSQQPKATP
jgi:hypothetical protein